MQYSKLSTQVLTPPLYVRYITYIVKYIDSKKISTLQGFILIQEAGKLEENEFIHNIEFSYKV